MKLLLIEQLASVQLDDDSSLPSELRGAQLALRRAWPRSDEHLLLEYLDDRGRIVPGQWMRDVAKLQRVADETTDCCPDAPPIVVARDQGSILLQPRGADRRLVGLRALLARSGATLISHRPERRAVVRLDDSSGQRFAKVVRPSRVRELLTTPAHIEDPSNRPFAVPEVLEVDEDQGFVICSALAGVSFHELVHDIEKLVPAARATGKALRWLHAEAPHPQTTHDAHAEIGVLQKWIGRVEAFGTNEIPDFNDAATRVFQNLKGDACPFTMIHRDFYDKQIIVDHDSSVGLLDFDTAATGESALDLANMLAHLELRVLQGRCSAESASRAVDAILEGYDPSPPVSARLGAYYSATRLRLACVYTFRPQWRHLVPELLRRIELPLLHDVHALSVERCASAKYPKS